MTSITDEVKSDLTDGLEYLEKMAGRLKTAAPGIIARAEAEAATPLGKTATELAVALGDTVLPPEAVTFIKGILDYAVSKWGPAEETTAPAAPAAEEAPAPAAAPAEAPASPLAGGVSM
jgi:hypothetical protein